MPTPTRRPRPLLVVLFGAAVLTSACDRLFGPNSDADTIEIEGSRLTLTTIGDTVHLSATVKDNGGATVAEATVDWLSRPDTVASISPEGVVTAHGTGLAWAVATSGRARDSAQIRVASPVGCAAVGDLVVEDTVTGALAAGDCRQEGFYIDLWRFTVDAEQVVTIDLVSGDFDTILILVDSDGDFIELDDDGGTGFNSRIGLTLQPGTYYVYATSFSSGTTGSYELRTMEGHAPSPCPAMGSVAFPDTVTADITSEACNFNGFYIDVWRLDLPADTVLMLRVDTEGFQPGLLVADTLGRFIDGLSIPASTVVLEVGLPAGQYDIWVGPNQTAQTGSYTMSVQAGPATLACPAAGALDVPETVSGEVRTDGCALLYGHAEGWDLELADTTELELTLTAESFPPLLLLSDSTGTLFDGIGSVDGIARLERQLPTGSYRVWAVAEFGLNGGYDLTVARAGELPQCDADGSIAMGDTIAGALATTDCILAGGRYADLWTTRLDTAATVRLSLSSDKFDAFLVAADSTGQRIARDDDSGTDTNAALTLELEPGLYQVWATSYAPDEVGGYELVLDAAAAAAAANTGTDTPTLKRSIPWTGPAQPWGFEGETRSLPWIGPDKTD